MGRTIFLALAILGLDLLLYFLFQWTYGDRRRRISKHVATYRATDNVPFIVETHRASGRRPQEVHEVWRRVQ
jgi:hypothetical protein